MVCINERTNRQRSGLGRHGYEYGTDLLLVGFAEQDSARIEVWVALFLRWKRVLSLRFRGVFSPRINSCADTPVSGRRDRGGVAQAAGRVRRDSVLDR